MGKYLWSAWVTSDGLSSDWECSPIRSPIKVLGMSALLSEWDERVVVCMDGCEWEESLSGVCNELVDYACWLSDETGLDISDCLMFQWVIIFNGLSGDSRQRGPYSLYKPWLHGLYGPRCSLSPERPLNLITHSLKASKTVIQASGFGQRYLLNQIQMI